MEPRQHGEVRAVRVDHGDLIVVGEEGDPAGRGPDRIRRREVARAALRRDDPAEPRAVATDRPDSVASRASFIFARDDERTAVRRPRAITATVPPPNRKVDEGMAGAD